MSAIMEMTIYPVGKGESLSPYVARVLTCIRESGLPFVFGPMSTSIEGELDELLALAAKCHAALRQDCRRVEMSLHVDWRQGKNGRLESKVRSVEEKMPPAAGRD